MTTILSPADIAMRHRLLGIEAHALTMGNLHERIGAAIAAGERSIIAHHNLHSAQLCRRDETTRAFYQRADWIHIDGMPLVLAGRLMGLPLRREHRVTFADWLGPLMAEAAGRGWRVFYLGSRPGVAERGGQRFRERHPELRIATHHGHFDARPGGAENEAVLDTIRAFAPHVLMVGMGMPRQEHWVLENVERIEANAVLTCGAAMDYPAGAIPTPPRWMGRVGLEWLYRLGSEPRRLWRRYLVEPWPLLGPLAQDLWCARVRRRPGR